MSVFLGGYELMEDESNNAAKLLIAVEKIDRKTPGADTIMSDFLNDKACLVEGIETLLDIAT